MKFYSGIIVGSLIRCITFYLLGGEGGAGGRGGGGGKRRAFLVSLAAFLKPFLTAFASAFRLASSWARRRSGLGGAGGLGGGTGLGGCCMSVGIASLRLSAFSVCALITVVPAKNSDANNNVFMTLVLIKCKIAVSSLKIIIVFGGKLT